MEITNVIKDFYIIPDADWGYLAVKGTEDDLKGFKVRLQLEGKFTTKLAAERAIQAYESAEKAVLEKRKDIKVGRPKGS